jgi:putative hydrolase of the HAD superfamily
LPRFSAVVFDLYGTLVDFSLEAFETSMADMAHLLRLPPAEFDLQFREHFLDMEFGRVELRTVLEEVSAALGHTQSEQRLKEAIECWETGVLQSLEPRPGALAALTTLHEAGLKLGVITNAVQAIADFWPRTRFAPLIEAPVISAAVKIRKPDASIYALGADRLGVAPARCLFIGDGSSSELSGAVAAGMSALQLLLPDREDERTLIFLNREKWTGPVAHSFMQVLEFAR